MKKLSVLVIVLLLVFTIKAQTVEKTYHFDSPQVTELRGYQQVTFNGTMQSALQGQPSLPYYAVSLLLPQGAEAESIEVELSDFQEVGENISLFPRQPSRTMNDDAPRKLVKDEAIYASKGVYPAENHGVVTTQYLNGFGFAFSAFTPVQYIPATGKVMFAQTAKVTVNLASAKADHSAMLWNTKANVNKISKLAQNPEMVDSYRTRGREVNGYDMLLITGEAYLDGFDEYLNYYDSIGVRNEVITVEEIYSTMEGRDNPEKVRNYIIQEYQDNGIELVVLGGDVNIVPYRGFYCDVFSDGEHIIDYGIPADLYFAGLDGTWNDNNDDKWGEIGEDDLLPEIGIGRLSFSDASKQANMINKSLRYQRHPVLGEFHNVTLAGEWLLGDPEIWGSDYLELLVGEHDDNGYTTNCIPTDYNYTRLYYQDGTWSHGNLENAINSGTQYVHHSGHANANSVAGWSKNNITDSRFFGSNGINHNYTFFHSHGCECGSFDVDCIMERMISIENFAVCAIGNSRYGWFNEGQTEGPTVHLEREMCDAQFNDRIRFIGCQLTEGKCATAPFVNAPGQWEEGALRWNFYDLNVLGDGAVTPWLDEPFTPDISLHGHLKTEAHSFDVEIKDKNGNPQKNFKCVAYNGDVALCMGYSDESGIATLEFDAGIQTVDELTMTVNGTNAWPQRINVDIAFINANPNYDGCGIVSGSGTYSHNSTATLTAVPNPGYEFSNWTENGEVVSTDTEYSFTVNTGRNLVANFDVAPLTLTALEDNTVIGLDMIGEPNINTLQYSYDGLSWNNITDDITFNTLGAGQYIMFRSWNQVSHGADENHINFSDQSGSYKVSGNINTLINYNDVDNVTLENYAFSNLFNGCTRLTDASELLLPSSYLAEGCYWYMFSGCTSLAQAPALPATGLAKWCYSHMFEECESLAEAPALRGGVAVGCYDAMFANCNSLTEAPELPATILAASCYNAMFSGCSSLTEAPELPATTLAENCYRYMFEGCSLLSSVTTHATTWNSDYASGWLSGVSETGDFYNLGQADIPTGTSGIPEGWTEYRQRTITAIANNSDYGTVSGAGTYFVGATCTLTAMPNTNYTFINWTENGEEVSTDATYSFTVSSDRSLVANFIVTPDYFTLTATSDNTVIGLEVNGEPDISTLQYSYDGINWNNITETTTFSTLQNGESVKFRSDNQISDFWSDWINFTDGSGSYSASGNISTLVKYSDTGNATIGAYAFMSLFSDCNHLTDISDLIMPSTTLADYCYWRMFSNCTGLTSIPTGLLPAMTLASNCYEYMFSGCTSLVEAPELPATTLASNCYSQMFSGCSSLVEAPELPATTMAEWCYYGMFSGCTSLVEAPELPATTLASNCYSQMFSDCSSLVEAPELPATTMVNKCYNGMFSGCTSLVEAPELPATTMAEGCYVNMFYGCTSLVEAHDLPTATLASMCYTFMFSGCTSLVEAPELPATTLASMCYACMFGGCISLVEAPDLPATTMAYGCYASMFSGCTSLVEAPNLSATALAPSCYVSMFSGCSSLNSVTTYATTWSSDYANGWLLGVSATGDFYNLGQADIPTGTSGIPEGWTEHATAPITITASANNPNYGTVTGGGTFNYGATATLTATPNTGYTFTNWTENDDEVSTDATYSFTVSENRNLVANFQASSPGGNHWVPDPSLYADNMSIVGEIQIDGVTQTSSDIEIGAFCGSEVRGSYRIEYKPEPIDKYLVFLTVYGESNDNITFKLYNHQTESEYNLTAPAAITFAPNATFGDLVNPHVLNFCHTQSCELAAGWNWYSTYIDIEGEDGFNMLTTGLGEDGLQVKSQLQFALYYQGYNIWSGSLTEADNTKLYKINMLTAHTLQMSGQSTDVQSTPITINKGWNWIGYPVAESMSLSDATSNITPSDGDFFKSQNEFSIYYEGYGWSGSLNTLEPGRGYMYKNTGTSAMNLIYPTPNAKGTLEENVTVDGNHWIPNVYQYVENMSIVAVININGVEQMSENLEIGVFSNGECRGSARPIYVEAVGRYMLFMTVYGEDNENLDFKLFDAERNEEYKLEAKMDFEANGTIGNLVNPYVFDLSIMGLGEDQPFAFSFYPNPVSSGKQLTIEGEYDKIEIINSLGVVIGEYTNTNKIEITMIPGIYYIRVINDKSMIINKLVVKQ